MSKRKLGTYKTSVALAGMCPTKPLISIQSAIASRKVTRSSALDERLLTLGSHRITGGCSGIGIHDSEETGCDIQGRLRSDSLWLDPFSRKSSLVATPDSRALRYVVRVMGVCKIRIVD